MTEREVPEGARAVPGFQRLAVSREGGLWSLASGSWTAVDPEASGLRRYVDEMTRRAWPPEVRRSPFAPEGWTDGLRVLPVG
jgi:hypothetical protein